MINFNKEEVDYIQGELQKLLYNNDEAYILMREGLTEEDIEDIQYFINDVSNVNDDEGESKKFIDIVTEHLGMWCFVDEEYTYNELLALIKDKMYCDIYKKLIIDKEE